MSAILARSLTVAIVAICICAGHALEVAVAEHESDDLMKQTYHVDGVKCAIAYDDDTFDEFADTMIARRSFGLLSLAFNSPSAQDLNTMASSELPSTIHGLVAVVSSVIPFVILCVQIGFAVSVFLYHFTNRFQVKPEEADDHPANQGGVVDESETLIKRMSMPPKVGMFNVKLASVSVVALYISRFWVQAVLAYSMAFAKHYPVSVTRHGHTEDMTWMADGICLSGSYADFFVTWIIDVGMPFLNIYVVYHSSSTMDIVLNSLAMEFVANLDNEYKSAVMGGFRLYTRYIVDADIVPFACHDYANCNGPDIAMWSQVFCIGSLIVMLVCGCVFIARK